jgi:hypothetical protein
MKTVTVNFETTGTNKTYDAKLINALYDYQGAQVGSFSRDRATFKVSAPTSELDFDYILSKLSKVI